MERSLKGHWGSRTLDDVLYQIAFDFVAQLEELMDSEGIGRAELAERLGVSKGRVSQILNNPGNLTLKNVVQYSQALDLQVTIVTYHPKAARNQNGPIHPQVFVACWQKSGEPDTMSNAKAVVAANEGTELADKYRWEPLREPLTLDDEAGTTNDTDEYDNGDYRPSLNHGDLSYAGTNTNQLYP